MLILSHLPPWLGELDIHLFNEGNHLSPYKKLGAQPCQHQGIKGVAFSVWAPNAFHVAVVGDFNGWDGRCHPMQNLLHHGKKSGYWSIFIPQANAGDCYKFEIKDQEKKLLPFKADPYGQAAQLRPETASVVRRASQFTWNDQQWLAKRKQFNSRNAPISIYELHLGSWRRDPHNQYLNYREIAKQLIPYVTALGFTHIQLMPISEHPFDGSWGYQPIGLFAPSARFGDADDFRYLIDQCHQAELGVLIDWVPGHFPTDEHGLAQFDGSYLYEHEDPRQGFHPDWNTLIYNFGRTEVANFLRASALFWLDEFHIDGIRVDAVASMLYLDYSREQGEWLPNQFGGRENLDAIAFIKRFNQELYQHFPDCISIAEESTAWPGVSAPVHLGGLGFGYKWNMGWMNDSLQYIHRDPINRCHHHQELSFSLVYAFNENFILPISHDEVVHGKGSMLSKMPGDAWQKFANLRAFYGFMWAHPGKKLLFMGCEFAQGREWHHDHALDWHQLSIDWHTGVQRFISDLNQLYKTMPALYQLDCQAEGFQWLDHQNAQQSIYSFMRFDQQHQQVVIIVCNFTPCSYDNYKIGVPFNGQYREVINSDHAQYGGSNTLNDQALVSQNSSWQGQAYHLSLAIPGLSTIMLTHVREEA